MLNEQVQTDTITLTPAAAQAVNELLTKRNLQGYALRIFISGGGCSGYQYGMALENNIREQDLKFPQHGLQVVVDEVSIDYLRGATVDYEENLMGGGFKIENPNALSSCGCGSSFKTKEGSSAGSQAASGCGSGCGCG